LSGGSHRCGRKRQTRLGQGRKRQWRSQRGRESDGFALFLERIGGEEVIEKEDGEDVLEEVEEGTLLLRRADLEEQHPPLVDWLSLEEVRQVAKAPDDHVADGGLRRGKVL